MASGDALPVRRRNLIAAITRTPTPNQSQEHSTSSGRQPLAVNTPQRINLIDLTSDGESEPRNAGGISSEDDEEDVVLKRPRLALSDRVKLQETRPGAPETTLSLRSIPSSIAQANGTPVSPGSSTTPQRPVKRPRGRPRKNPLPDAGLVQHAHVIKRSSIVNGGSRASSANSPRSYTPLDPDRTWMNGHADHPFVRSLSQLTGPPVTITNTVDDSGPPTGFTFVPANVFHDDVPPPDPASFTGCSCRPDCSLRNCECLEDAAVKEDGKPIGFPYYAVEDKKGLLRNLYLDERHPIYECNQLCKCTASCKSRVVQWGRTVPLEIFKTPSRGWGLRAMTPIRRGQFVDTYRGEIITDGEAKRREAAAAADPSSSSKDSYLFDLDKFQGEPGDYGYIPDADLYVIDGQFVGGPTRFINHSCDPNLRTYTVSFHRGNPRIFELAFFAVRDIAPGTELTFHYADDADQEHDFDHPGKTKCLCGAPNCEKSMDGSSRGECDPAEPPDIVPRGEVCHFCGKTVVKWHSVGI